MKLLVYNPLVAVWRPRLPAVLSVIQDSIDAGHEVVHIGCDGKLPACTANLEHGRSICSYCVKRGRNGLGLLIGQYSDRVLTNYISAERLEALKGEVDQFDDLQQLRALTHGAMDIGYAALSSCAHVARNSEPNLENPLVRRVIQRLLNTGKIVFEAISEAITAENPDRVIIYHGRSAIDRAALRACDDQGVECHVYETALGVNKLIYFRNALPQDIGNFVDTVDELWRNAPEDKREIGKLFFEMRRGGTMSASEGGAKIATQDRVYVGSQEPGYLPESWSSEQRNIVIYGSSDDEFVAISPEYEATIYPDQLEATRRIAESLLEDPALHLYFRVHPRQKGVDNEYTRGLGRLETEFANLTVVPADSKVSSYSLLDHADSVLAFRSTMSIEAVYWKKPSIILSSSIFKPLGATYNPESHDEVIEMIRAALPPKDLTPALKVGYFRMRGGFTHPYFEGDIRKGSRGYTFKGNRIAVGRLQRMRYFIARERQRKKWRSMA
ncbi:MAG: hypothetical protein ACR2QQ_10800 [Gammaproteobacteria bacterium]